MPENRKELSTAEREAHLEKKIQLQQQRIQRAERTLRMLGHRASEEERRMRTRRLIQLGAVVDQWLGREGDPQILSKVLASAVHTDIEENITLGEILHKDYQANLLK